MATPTSELTYFAHLAPRRSGVCLQGHSLKIRIGGVTQKKFKITLIDLRDIIFICILLFIQQDASTRKIRQYKINSSEPLLYKYKNHKDKKAKVFFLLLYFYILERPRSTILRSKPGIKIKYFNRSFTSRPI